MAAAQRNLFAPATKGLVLLNRHCRPVCLKALEPQVPPRSVRDDLLHGAGFVFEGMENYQREGKRPTEFDNSRPVPERRESGLRRRRANDRWHGRRSIGSYGYKDAATMIEEFWTEVDEVLNKGGDRMKILKIGKVGFDRKKARTTAIARGESNPGKA